MTIKLLRPLPNARVAPPRLPRCEAAVDMATAHMRDWRADAQRKGLGRYGEGRVDQCTRDAVVTLDGAPMCRRHAGQRVLDLYLSGELVRKEG